MYSTACVWRRTTFAAKGERALVTVRLSMVTPSVTVNFRFSKRIRRCIQLPEAGPTLRP